MEPLISEILEFGSEFLIEFRYIFWYFVSGVVLEAIVRTYGWHIQLRKTLERMGVGAI